MVCSKTNTQCTLHNKMRDLFRKLGRHNGLSIANAEPRGLPNTHGFTGGADLQIKGLPIVDPVADKVNVIVDFTFPTVLAHSNVTNLIQNNPGATARRHEQRKIQDTTYLADATNNGMQFIPAAQEKETTRYGPGYEHLIKRMAQNKKGAVYEDDPHNEYGFRQGMWHVPTAEKYFRTALAVALINARENAIAMSYRRASAPSG